jgi:hypothetical protein
MVTNKDNSKMGYRHWNSLSNNEYRQNINGIDCPRGNKKETHMINTFRETNNLSRDPDKANNLSR